MATDYHAEHVGSLLRPPWLLGARAQYQRGELDESGLRAAEDRAAGENLALQRDALTAAGCERIFTDTMTGTSTGDAITMHPISNTRFQPGIRTELLLGDFQTKGCSCRRFMRVDGNPVA